MNSFEAAAKRMDLRAKLLQGRIGRVYSPEITQDMQEAIRGNADSSYGGSPAVLMAIASANRWIHQDPYHFLNIMSTAYANYRQYGCGGLPITPLVVVTEKDRAEMRNVFAEVLSNPESLQ